MTTEEQWKEELEKMWHVVNFGETVSFIEHLLYSQKEALMRKAIACVPEKDIAKLGSENQEIYQAYEKGFNDCREQTLQKLGEILNEKY